MTVTFSGEITATVDGERAPERAFWRAVERAYLATSMSARPIEQVWKLLEDTGNWSV